MHVNKIVNHFKLWICNFIPLFEKVLLFIHVDLFPFVNWAQDMSRLKNEINHEWSIMK